MKVEIVETATHFVVRGKRLYGKYRSLLAATYRRLQVLESSKHWPKAKKGSRA